MRDETTARICRRELLELLDTTRSAERITAEMPIVVLDDLLRPEPPPPPLKITFRAQSRAA